MRLSPGRGAITADAVFVRRLRDRARIGFAEALGFGSSRTCASASWLSQSAAERSSNGSCGPRFREQVTVGGCRSDTHSDPRLDVAYIPGANLFAPGAGITLAGGGLEANGATFDRLDPALPWGGLDVVRAGERYVDLPPVTLVGATVAGAESPAIRWSAAERQELLLTDTVIRDVAGDVCIAGCVGVDESNTLDCAVPLECRPRATARPRPRRSTPGSRRCSCRSRSPGSPP
jgi:hypothetical protein